MKNIAIWVIVVVVAANFIAVRKSERRAAEARRAQAEAYRQAEEVREATRHQIVRVVNGQVTTSVSHDDGETAIVIDRQGTNDKGRRITVHRGQVVIDEGDHKPSSSSRRRPAVAPPKPPAPPAPPEPARAPKKKTSQQLADVPPPAWLPKSEAALQELEKVDEKGFRVLVGKVSASPEKAREELRKALEQEVAKWASPDVPTDWRAPKDVYDAIGGEVYLQPIAQEIETDPKSPEIYVVYRGIQKADFSDASRERVVDVHQQQLVTARLVKLGGGLGFVLVCLGCLTGYVRADEATKGYYTNRLRLAAAVGAGVAGTAIYQMLG